MPLKWTAIPLLQHKEKVIELFYLYTVQIYLCLDKGNIGAILYKSLLIHIINMFKNMFFDVKDIQKCTVWQIQKSKKDEAYISFSEL